MAPQPKKRLRITSSTNAGILSRVTTTISDSTIVIYARQAAADATFISKKLLKSTGKAAWIAGTTFLILAVPLIIEMDREQQVTDMELQQQSLLGPPPSLVTGQR